MHSDKSTFGMLRKGSGGKRECNLKDYWILLWSKLSFESDRIRSKFAFGETTEIPKICLLDVGQTVLDEDMDDTVIVRIYHNSISTFNQKAKDAKKRIQCSSFMEGKNLNFPSTIEADEKKVWDKSFHWIILWYDYQLHPMDIGWNIMWTMKI